MTAPLLLDLSHTSHTRARTGVQRVTRTLWRESGAAAQAVTWDPFADCWRPLATWEQANLRADSPAAKRSASWPLVARWRGRLRRTARRAASPAPAGSALIVPEIFSAAIASALPGLFAAVTGPRVAIFHDAIALKYPEFSAPATVTRFPSYLQELLRFDGVAAVSEDSRASLVDYWRWLGAVAPPPVTAIPLGLDQPNPRPGVAAPASVVPVVLSVGSLEGRKNHVALLSACEELWRAGRNFQLRLIGMAHGETGRPALEQIAALQREGRPVRYEGPVSEQALEEAYAEATFTVYPSLMEGYGLPVAESLVRGKPCICSAGGAVGEIAWGGGCLALDRVDARNLREACDRLLLNPAERHSLSEAARRRHFPSWADYLETMRSWMATLSQRR
jgi:glycosyltransferase involved in cell wall biosynthesis